jgi:hypothetical protein
MVKMIQPGLMTPYMVGMDSCTAEVLGLVREGEQYLLMIRYYELNEQDERVLVRRLFQRDRYTIEGLYRDAGGTI